jgi:glycosyltransferase involved in cell wall biosynthesis
MNRRHLDSAIVVSHSAGRFGSVDALIDFLKPRVRVLVVVDHPFHYCEDRRSKAYLCISGETVYEWKSPSVDLPETVLFLKDFLLTPYLVMRMALKRRALSYGAYVGADPLNAVNGVLLRAVGVVRVSVFYVIDYSSRRFGDSVRNWLYQKLVRFALRFSDFTWNTSPRVAEVSERLGVKKERNLIVRHGVYAPEVTARHTCMNRLVFVGHIVEKSGVGLIVEALPDIVDRYPDVRLYILGDGEYEGILRQLVEKHRVWKHVVLLGAVPHSRVMRFLSHCDVALAPYPPELSWHSEFADTGLKVMEYLACGLPVITTDVIAVAKQVREKPLGVVIEYNKKAMTEAVVRLLGDRQFYEECKSNVHAFPVLYWDRIFSEALKETGFAF